jgi:hypothetical protein
MNLPEVDDDDDIKTVIERTIHKGGHHFAWVGDHLSGKWICINCGASLMFSVQISCNEERMNRALK